MTVPLDPFVWLYKTFDLERIEPYNELWMKDLVALDYIKRSRALSGKPKSEKCWEDRLDGMIIVFSLFKLTYSQQNMPFSRFIGLYPPF